MQGRRDLTEQGSTKNRAARFRRPWRPDRRRAKCLLPAPYRTADGLIDSDRRSYLDRRSAWIREYLINGDDGDSP